MTSRPTPLLSIVTISRNDPSGLSRTLESLRAFRALPFPWEQVIVDSSPEANEPVIRKYEKDWNLRRLIQPASGIYPAINSGWRESAGSYVWFLNGGDEACSPAVAQEACEMLERDPQLAIAYGAVRLMRGGELTYSRAPQLGLRPLLGINRVCQQQLIYRKSLIASLGGFTEEFKLASDYEFHLRAMAVRAKTGAVPGDLVTFDMGGQSANASATLQEFRRIHQALHQKHLLKFPQLHFLIWAYESHRIRAFQCLGAGPAGMLLKKSWYALKRRRS